MPAGEQLRQRAQQFAVKYDEVSHSWRVLDTWSKDLEKLQATDEIADNHPAMTLLPMSAMIEVVRAAESLNLLEHMFGGVSEEEFAEVQEKLTIAETTVTTLEEQLELNRTEDIRNLKDLYKDFEEIHKAQTITETINTRVPQVAKDPLSDQSQVAIAAIQALTQITGQSQLDKVVNGRTINT